MIFTHHIWGRAIIFTPRGTDINLYPAIKKHLSQYREKLESRALDQQWFELQQAQVAFEKYFRGTKIVYPDIGETPSFALNSGAYLDMTCFCIYSDDAWLLALLNSATTHFWLSLKSATVRGGYLRFKTQYIKTIPIPSIHEPDKNKLTGLAQKAARAEGPEHTAIENEINQIVYRLFDLTPEEIRLIEGTINKTPEPPSSTSL